MGKVVEKKRKKKKGRPSLLDLQKRSLKQQQEQLHKQQQFRNKIQNPSSDSGVRRSTRRNPNPNSDDEERSSGKRREKKLKLVLKLTDDEDNSESDSNPDEEGSSGLNLRKRKIDSIAPGSGLSNDDKSEKHSAAAKQASIKQGSKLDDGPLTPLPDKKLLLFILERLQKKDTYGVFAEPVDPEELPDYHEVIEHPMDFGTIRKKLADGAYSNLEQFEKDILLICSNAMQYNAPDTIYFRQARSIQELAKKDFENLRQDSDDNEPEPELEPKVVRRGRPPTKNLKRPLGRPPLERSNSNFSEATLTSTGGNTNRSNSDVRKGHPLVEKQGSVDLFARSLYGSCYGEACFGWSAERYDTSEDMIGSASKGISVKHGKKNIVLDENRRNTYKQTCVLACRQEPAVLATFDGERKLLIPVGLHTEYVYARSLSRFAAKLGSVAWKVASRKIEKCLPADIKFGLGWVGENEATAERRTQQQASLSIHGDASSVPSQGVVESRSGRSLQKPKEEQLSEMPTSSSQSTLDNGSKNAPAPSVPAINATPVSFSPIISSNGTTSKLSAPEASSSFHPNTTFNMLTSSTGTAMRGGYINQSHQSSPNQSHINGLNGGYGLNFAAQMGKMIGAARPNVFNHQLNPSIVTISRTESQSLGSPSGDNNGCGEAKLSDKSCTIKPSDCSPNAGPHQKVGPGPPDLNVGFQSPGSPGSGRGADSVQPDLVLQLLK